MFENFKLKSVNKKIAEIEAQIVSNQKEIIRMEKKLSEIPENIEFLKKILKITDERTQEYINDNGHDDFSNKIIDASLNRSAKIYYLEEDLKRIPEIIKSLKAELFDLEKEYKKEKLKEKVYSLTEGKQNYNETRFCKKIKS